MGRNRYNKHYRKPRYEHKPSHYHEEKKTIMGEIKRGIKGVAREIEKAGRGIKRVHQRHVEKIRAERKVEEAMLQREARRLGVTPEQLRIYLEKQEREQRRADREYRRREIKRKFEEFSEKAEEVGEYAEKVGTYARRAGEAGLGITNQPPVNRLNDVLFGGTQGLTNTNLQASLIGGVRRLPNNNLQSKKKKKPTQSRYEIIPGRIKI